MTLLVFVLNNLEILEEVLDARGIWMGFLPQAGVTIGIATIIEREFAWSAEVKTVVLAMVALNQLIGPVALKFLLVRRGEARAQAIPRRR